MPGGQNVRECPAALDLAAAQHRVVMQHLGGELVVWREYPIADDSGSGLYCVVQEKPSSKTLTVPEARALMASSSSAADRQPAAATGNTVRPDDSRLNLDFESTDRHGVRDGEAGAAYVLGSDDRERVNDSTSFPWNTIAFVSTTFPNGEGSRGSAFLVGPHLALTNAHIVYHEDAGGWATSLELSPGQTQQREAATVRRPFGTRTKATLSRPSAWSSDADDPADDYAAIFFCEPFDGIDRYMPLVWNQTASRINLAGYPGDVRGEEDSYALWHSVGDVLSDDDRALTYTADSSAGNSGGPVWIDTSDTGQRRVIAIHAFGFEIDGTPVSNGGPHLVSENRGIIEEWLAESPGTGRLSDCAPVPRTPTPSRTRTPTRNPEPRPDIHAIEAFFRTDFQNGGRVSQPIASQRVFPHVSYEVLGGVDAPSMLVEAFVDGTRICQTFARVDSGPAHERGCGRSWQVTPGRHTLRWELDATHDIPERNEANNAVEVSFTVNDPAPVRCVADCDGSGQVTVDEVVTAINLALATQVEVQCSAADSSGDGAVTIDEVVQAVTAALQGCRQGG